MAANGNAYDLLRGDNRVPRPWLEAFDTWVSRVGARIAWTDTELVQPGNVRVWKAEVSINGHLVPGIAGTGSKKAEAKADAVRQMQERGDIITRPLNEPYATPVP